MAPELLDGERVGPATDIYGLACLADETLTGTVPFPRDTDAATMYAHIVDPPPSVRERRPELPRALDDVLAAGMAKDPDDRPASAGALVADMLEALGRPVPACLAQAAEGCDRLTRPDQQATAVGGEALNGRYEFVAPISSGAMGAVYRAIDRETGTDVAVKRLLDVRHAARFEIEARLLASLSHPRVVKVLDHSSDEQGPYIVMELVHGVDLGAILKRNGDPGLTLGDAIEYARHGCEALPYVHGQQIVHRDVKPQNMILGDDGVILVDFGVARALGASREDQGTIAVGTPRYMAPEVFAGGTVCAASDIFSLAATLWTLLIGSPPRYGDVLKLDKLAPGLPPELPRRSPAASRCCPSSGSPRAAAFAEAVGVPLTGDRGHSLAQCLGRPTTRRRVMEAIVRTAAGMFDAAACSIALTDPKNGELVYEAAWGAGASEVVGMRLPPGVGIAGAVVATGEGVFVPECRKDPRFARQVAAGTGYVPYTMVVAPLVRDGKTIGVLAVLDRRDGGPYLREDLAQGGAVRRPRGRRAGPRHVPAVELRRAHAPGLTCRT